MSLAAAVSAELKSSTPACLTESLGEVLLLLIAVDSSSGDGSQLESRREHALLRERLSVRSCNNT